MIGIRLTNMLNLATLYHPLAQIPSNASLKHLHHHPKQAPSQSSIPSSLRRSVSDESVLSLDLVKLRGCQVIVSGISAGNLEIAAMNGRLTEKMTLASSKAFRMASLPSLGTCVS